MQADDVPLICDPPPRARWILRSAKPLTLEQMKHLRDAWAEAMNDPAQRPIILADGLSIEVLPGRYEWPDAEFCAA